MTRKENMPQKGEAPDGVAGWRGTPRLFSAEASERPEPGAISPVLSV
jgi:hypothetical protein